ncbi:HAD-IIB family hydrolase [Mycoplasma phocoeninasale]|uniref:HAD-IIB family hydrolase n=1 Tax=Mycoplasma phocoeninasale TaxID=2726117 RepID=A0A858U203_9MOLU|nr:HAD-IIB family hydrolase [Mycoplasma phocoeninasale]MBN0970435.1 HAD-IIB family hydrolase [Mycoplasma phocoeninasale]QJG66442.1 HAD-IIB family hydrolase [Mycoplasma phocoeninasale]
MLNFKPRAYFLDLDGTFLDLPKTENRVSEDNINIARQLNDQGIPVILSTGRRNSEFVVNLANKINSPYIVCQNGGLIVDSNNNVLKKCEIKRDSALKVIEILKKEKMFFMINSLPIIYGASTKIFMARPWTKKMEIKKYDEIPQISNVTKILTFGKFSTRGIKKIKESLEANFFNLKFHIVSKGWSIEINDMNATKGIANSYICQLLNIDPKKAVHFGDSGNDVSVKSYVGAFVVMKNAARNIKKHGDIIGYSYKRSGVAKTIKNLFMTKK